ncbi:MAG: hypothetical protein R2795_05160 [Saprospiraceae bacterium]
MNAENFSAYLDHPAKLWQLPYQEIKNLVEEYPYAANLRWLLAIKSSMEHDPRFPQHLHALAAHTYDRAALRAFIKTHLPELVGIATQIEERLELRHWEELELAAKEPLPP